MMSRGDFTLGTKYTKTLMFLSTGALPDFCNALDILVKHLSELPPQDQDIYTKYALKTLITMQGLLVPIQKKGIVATLMNDPNQMRELIKDFWHKHDIREHDDFDAYTAQITNLMFALPVAIRGLCQSEAIKAEPLQETMKVLLDLAVSIGGRMFDASRFNPTVIFANPFFKEKFKDDGETSRLDLAKLIIITATTAAEFLSKRLGVTYTIHRTVKGYLDNHATKTKGWDNLKDCSAYEAQLNTVCNLGESAFLKNYYTPEEAAVVQQEEVMVVDPANGAKEYTNEGRSQSSSGSLSDTVSAITQLGINPLPVTVTTTATTDTPADATGRFMPQ